MTPCPDTMVASLAFVQHDIHRELLESIFLSMRDDDMVTGLILTGSVARGDAFPGSDLDLYALLEDGCSRPFDSYTSRGIVVEVGYANFDLAQRKLHDNPMSVYRYIDGHVLYDSQGLLHRLVAITRERFNTYQVAEENRRSMAYSLKSARVKITAAREAGDMFKAAYVVGTISWPLLEGLWATAGKPMPSNGSVLPHLCDLETTIPGVSELLHRLFLAGTIERIEAALELIDLTASRLRKQE